VILLDTNVISEAIKPQPHASVLAWFDAQATGALFLSSITVAGFLFGIRVLPVGRRKDLLTERIGRLLEQFTARILPFDTPAAQHYADLAVKARASGQGFPKPDGYIAAIAAAHGFAVASRDASAFSAAGLKVINPWNAGA
jgi:predicted nucleic acid-binding protein